MPIKTPFSGLEMPPEDASPAALHGYLTRVLAAFDAAPTADSRALGGRLTAALEAFADAEPGPDSEATFAHDLGEIERDVFGLARQELKRLRAWAAAQSKRQRKGSGERAVLEDLARAFELYTDAVDRYLAYRDHPSAELRETYAEGFRQATALADGAVGQARALARK